MKNTTFAYIHIQQRKIKLHHAQYVLQFSQDYG